jgi:hypothetical protein
MIRGFFCAEGNGTLTRVEFHVSLTRPRKNPFNSFHAGATTNPVIGMEAAPINNPMTPDMAA